MAGTSKHNPILRLHFHRLIAICTQAQCSGLVMLRHKSDPSIRRKQYRPGKKRMRTDQCHFNAGQIRLNDGPPCGQGVCSGTGGCTEYNSVRPVPADEGIVRIHGKVRHPASVPGSIYVIERSIYADLLPFPPKGCPKHHPLTDPVLPGQQPGQLIQLIRFQGCHKAQSAGVDPQQLHVRTHQLSGTF